MTDDVTKLGFNVEDVDVHEKPKWTSADFGDAMVAAALQHATKQGKPRRDGSVDVNAWWRGGDDLHVRIWPGAGAARDLVEGRTYNARDFARVALGMTLPEMMERYGRTSSTPRPSPPAPAPSEPQRPTPEAVGAAWDALCSRRTHESPAARWLDARGIPARLAWSGFATLDTAAAGDLLASPSSSWLDRHVDAAIVAPIRSARTGDVVALQARAFTPATPAEKRRTIGKLSDEDGTPRAYGRPDHVGSASLVLLVEGLVDTLAADVLASYADRVVIVGAVDAGGMPKIAAWVASHSTAPVVVVRHLDGVGVEKDGAGQAAADEAVRLLGKRARHFAWARDGEERGFFRRLLALGVDASSHMKKGFDLGDALALAADEDVRISTVAASFLALVGAPLSQPGGSP
jgi:hypothetical protein